MILDAFSLQGKVAVVSGCDTGLGQGMALGLAEAGCDIVGINICRACGRRFFDVENSFARQWFKQSPMRKRRKTYGTVYHTDGCRT